MKFYHEKKRRNQATFGLLVGFALVLLATGVLIHLLGFLVGMLATGSANVDLGPATATTGVVWLIFLTGALFRWHSVRQGSSHLAKQLRATEILATTRDKEERECLELIAEMAIASSQSVPSVWCLQHIDAINALVLGKGDDVAMILTRGAMERLDREELQAVIAHEYGHLANGDLPLNMRLVILLGGLLAVDEVGLIVQGGRQGSLFHPGVIVGWFLRGAGFIGVLGGLLLRAAVSRQREYSADASAKQYTRNPQALAGALRKIMNSRYGDRVQMIREHEFDHMYFSHESRFQLPDWMRSGWFATHPSLRDRIMAIDPALLYAPPEKNESNHANPVATVKVSGMSASNVISLAAYARTMFMVDQDDIDHGSPNLGSSGLSDMFDLMVDDQLGAIAALIAMYANPECDKYSQFLNSISFAYNNDLSMAVSRMAENLKLEFTTKPVQVIDLCAKMLADTNLEGRRKLMVNIEKLLEVEQEISLRNFALLRIMRQALGVDFPMLQLPLAEGESAVIRFAASTDELTREIALILSLAFESSKRSETLIDTEYQRALQIYTLKHIPRRSQNEKGLVLELENALARVAALEYADREALLSHCEDIIANDETQAKRNNLVIKLLRLSINIENDQRLRLAA